MPAGRFQYLLLFRSMNKSLGHQVGTGKKASRQRLLPVDTLSNAVNHWEL
jgi:hypothetical protein